MKEKARQLQTKLAKSDKNVFMDDIKIKINEFFTKKLGKKQQYILKEFNENILQMAQEDIEKQQFKKLMDSFSAEGSQKDGSESAVSRRLANQFEHLSKRSDTVRASKNSHENIARVVRQVTELEKSLDTGSLLGSIHKSTNSLVEQKIDEENDEDAVDKKLTDT